MIRYSRRWLCPQYFPQLIALALGLAFMAVALTACQSAGKKPGEEIQPLAVQTFSRGWDNHLPLTAGDTLKSIWVRDDSIHLFSTKNYDFALKRSDGELLFMNPVSTPDIDLHGGPIMMKDQIAIPTTFTMECFDKRGHFQKSVPLNFTVTSGGVVTGTTIYIGSGNNRGELAAVDVSEPYNTVRWQKLAFGTVHSTPAVFEDDIYYASDDGAVRAVNEDQTGIWVELDGSAFKTERPIYADLRVDKFALYVTSTNGRLYALNRSSGKVKWQYFAGTPLYASPEITEATVYQYVPGTGLVALNKTEKQDLGEGVKPADEKLIHVPRWTCKEATQFLAEDDKYSYVLSGDRHILALDKQTGELMFHSARADFSIFGVNTKDGIIYAANKAGLVYAIQPVLKADQHGELVMDLDAVQKPLFASAR